MLAGLGLFAVMAILLPHGATSLALFISWFLAAHAARVPASRIANYRSLGRRRDT